MAILQVLVVTLLAEALVYSLFKGSSPSPAFKQWATIAVYLVVFVLSQTGIFNLVGAKVYGYADWAMTGIICSVGSDGVKTLIANLVSAQQQKVQQ
jgi:flagellar basal body-associated protein FliL